MDGGQRIAEVLERQGVRFLYTLCGGHISPILVAAKARGIRVVDVRDEANALFAADATGRITGIPGVAAVTAGPGVTNTLTALQNAQLAQSPVVLLGGSAATMLKGRGSLQDIDQMAVIQPHVKWAKAVRQVKDLGPTVEEAFRAALSGVPGPVFVECPIDLLYPKELVKSWYVGEAGKGGGGGMAQKAMRWYLERHADRLFAGAEVSNPGPRVEVAPSAPLGALVHAAALLLKRAERPVLLVGSQALARAGQAEAVAAAVARLQLPVYLAGMARGLLGPAHPLQMRHKRGAALKEADLVILAGVPCDFRLGYGRAISGKASVIAVNLSVTELFRNRRPTLPVPGDPGAFLERLAALGAGGDPRWSGWREQLRARDAARDQEIATLAAEPAPPVNPLAVCRAIEEVMSDDGVIVADGGDFVASASYVLRPRGPLRWLDPGVFGTLGVGGGFALASALCRPGAETWLIYGDGAAGFSLVELDSFVRHRLPVIAVVGNDACWSQIARDQVTYLKDDVGCPLARTDYDKVAEGYGAVGIRVAAAGELRPALERAKALAREGKPVLVNVHIGQTKFREGSISM